MISELKYVINRASDPVIVLTGGGAFRYKETLDKQLGLVCHQLGEVIGIYKGINFSLRNEQRIVFELTNNHQKSYFEKNVGFKIRQKGI